MANFGIYHFSQASRLWFLKPKRALEIKYLFLAFFVSFLTSFFKHRLVTLYDLNELRIHATLQKACQQNHKVSKSKGRPQYKTALLSKIHDSCIPYIFYQYKKVVLPSKHVPTCLCHSVLGKSRHATLLSISAVEAKSPRRRSLSFHATEAQWPLRHWPSPDNACMPRRRKGIVAEYSTWRRRTINKKPTKKTAKTPSQKQP